MIVEAWVLERLPLKSEHTVLSFLGTSTLTDQIGKQNPGGFKLYLFCRPKNKSCVSLQHSLFLITCW
ncbi:hypothetical protein BDE02_14G062800 [Populus trichocarpa]|nr:hypothetical protein BDE02_14G062800 [Populus trichocarpa]